MEKRQSKLFNYDVKLMSEQKVKMLEDLYKRLSQDFDVFIKHFGDVSSDIMFIGLAPHINHMKSKSRSAFAFDIDINQITLSGGVLCRVFKDLNLDITKFYFTNLYKVPIEYTNDFDKQLNHVFIENEIEIINPKLIICFGNECFNVIKKEIRGKKIIKVFHPAYVLRDGISYNKYKLIIEKAIKNV